MGQILAWNLLSWNRGVCFWLDEFPQNTHNPQNLDDTEYKASCHQYDDPNL